MIGAAARFLAAKAIVAAFAVTPTQINAATVGPLDGAAAPSLPPIGAPASMMVEELPDTSFPESLEKMGDTSAAALEWQRIAHKSVGALREKSLANAARLHMNLGETTIASTLIKSLLEENPASPYAQQALYTLATGPQSTLQTQSLTQLEEKFPGSPAAQEARLTQIWQEAQASGKIENTHNLPKAEELKKRLTALHITQQKDVTMASALGAVLPGAGHAYAGNVPQGLTVFIVFCLFALAFLSACRHKHYAYAFLFVIPAVAIWFSSPAVAMQLMKDKSRAELTKKLESYTDLKPADPFKAAPAAAPLPTPEIAPVTAPVTDIPALPPVLPQ